MNKSELISHLIGLQSSKITELKKLVDTLNESALGEDKCTVGDKHHTFRAQTQNEQEVYAKQLSSGIKDLNFLQTISTIKDFKSIESGALVNTSNGFYLISISMGIVNYEGQQIFVVSPVSPIASVMLGLKANDEFVFNGKKIVVKEVM